MNTTLKDLIKNLKKLPSTDAVRREDNSYAVEGNAIIALSLSKSELTELELGEEAVGLEHLYLSNNAKLRRVAIKQALPKLAYLYLNNCALEQFSFPIGCASLKQLYLQDNQLKKVGLEGSTKQLELIDLSNNAFEKLTFLKGVRNLRYLYLKDNKNLKALAFTTAPRKLEILHLAGCALEKLPDNFLSFNRLNTLYLDGNPLPLIPKASRSEGARANSYEGVWHYLLEKNKGQIKNDRVKIILVGNGRVGKTSMYRRLNDLPRQANEPYTHGIQLGELDKRKLPDVIGNSLQANVWDFGGQEIFYATHQFFLTEDALYILAWTLEENVQTYRKDEVLPDDDKFQTREYWLENIQHHGGKDCPILMVQTHADKKIEQINRKEYEEQYGTTSLNFSADTDVGLAQLKQMIAEKLNNHIPLFNEDFPSTYDKVIAEIEELSTQSNFITKAYFDTGICRKAGIEKGGEESVLRFLRKTGAVVWFPDVPALKETIYVNPNWLTQQVYRLINNDLRARKGKIDLAYLEKTFPDYTPNERQQFLALLNNFGLIFEPRNKPNTYISPQYLPPKLGEEAQDALDFTTSKLSLAFTFRFPRFFPDNVMINFLSKYGPFSRNLYWKNGICFQSQTGQDCMVQLAANNTLKVFTIDDPSAYALQSEVCRAFVELSKNANAEIILKERHVSWQELSEAVKNQVDKIKDCEGHYVTVTQFERFFDELGGRLKTEQTLETTMLTKRKIFLASSQDLREDRREFEIFINRRNKALVDKGIFLELVLWEDFIDALSQDRLQSEYNKAIKECDLFVMLFSTKVGKFTREEFEIAFGQFKETNRPWIYTYFKNENIAIGDIDMDDFLSLKSFQKKLKELGHFQTTYKSLGDLKAHFGDQLDKLMNDDFFK